MIKYLLLLIINFPCFAQFTVDLRLNKEIEEIHHCKGVIVGRHQIITAKHCIKDEEELKNIVLYYQNTPYKLHNINYEDKVKDLILIEVEGSFEVPGVSPMHDENSKELWLSFNNKCIKQKDNIYECEASEGDSGSPLLHKTNSDWLLRGILIEGDKKKGLIKISPISEELKNYIYVL